MREISNSSSLEDDKKQFEEKLEAELASYSKRSVIDLTEQEVARELLLRLYLMGCKFESIGGTLSRVAWMVMPEPSKKGNWQDAAKHRNDSMHGEPERVPEVRISRLYESHEYDFVKDLMRRAGMKIDTRTNHQEASTKGEDGMSKLYHFDPFLDRAHSTGLAYSLIVRDSLTRRAMKKVAKMQQLHTDATEKKQSWRNDDVARNAFVKVLLIVPRFRQRKQLDGDEMMAETNFKQAKTEYVEAQQSLCEALDAAYNQDVQGKHYHLQFGVARRRRMGEFYEKFFGRAWPYDAQAKDARDKQAKNDVSNPRLDELERIAKLRACLGMED